MAATSQIVPSFPCQVSTGGSVPLGGSVACDLPQADFWLSELPFLNLQNENQLIETLFGLLQGRGKSDVTRSTKELFGAINLGIKYIASCLMLQVLNPNVFSCSHAPSCCR